VRSRKSGVRSQDEKLDFCRLPTPELIPHGGIGIYMTHQELTYFKDLILRKRAEMLKDLGHIEQQSMNTTTSESSGGSSYSDHMPDLGSDAMEREKAFMFASRDGAYLSHLDEALERITAGTFGICRVCGGEIGRERLEAVPNATMCVTCKSEEDRKKRKV